MASGAPKTLHLFWGRSRPLSWLRLQTVVTFARLNPDWLLKVWYRDTEPKQPAWPTPEQKNQYTGKDYFDQLAGLATLCPVPVNHKVSDVHLSDYLRWWLLGNEGGFWSDFDIVYTRPMSDLPEFGGPFLVRYPCGTWPIGFLGAQDGPGRIFFREMERCALKRLGTAKGYQEIGCTLLAAVAKAWKPKAQDGLFVYPKYHLQDAERAYFKPGPYRVGAEFIGLHWYAGAEWASRYENSIDPDDPSPGHTNCGIYRAIVGA